MDRFSAQRQRERVSLEISLRVESGPKLLATYRNLGAEPVALAFWWNRFMRVVDPHGAVVAPGPGPVLPCGEQEDWTELNPGGAFEREEPLLCTQPAGGPPKVGWSYDLPPGIYRVKLVFEAPPSHGFNQSPPNPRAFKGRAESNEVEWLVSKQPRNGLLSRLLS